MSVEEIYEYEKKYERVSKETKQNGRTQFVGKIIELEQQLQTYKEKEDKLREYINSYKLDDINEYGGTNTLKEDNTKILDGSYL